MTQTNKETMEERFDKEFVITTAEYGAYLRYGMYCIGITKLKDFIRQEIDRAVKEYKVGLICGCGVGHCLTIKDGIITEDTLSLN